MKVLIVTSSMTFVPNNYNGFVLPFADVPEVVGVAVIENRSWSYVFKALLMIFTFSAPRMGFHVLKNTLFPGLKSRELAFKSNGKGYWVFQNPNQKECLDLLQQQSVDLVINARTRFIFRKPLLSATRLGCVNVHHGLLPEQRGLMCDFWAHVEGHPFGFSVHEMTEKIDEGQILRTVQTGENSLDYMNSISGSCAKEFSACRSVIEELREKNRIQGQPNVSERAVWRRNPSLLDLYRARLKGVKI